MDGFNHHYRYSLVQRIFRLCFEAHAYTSFSNSSVFFFFAQRLRHISHCHLLYTTAMNLCRFWYVSFPFMVVYSVGLNMWEWWEYQTIIQKHIERCTRWKRQSSNRVRYKWSTHAWLWAHSKFIRVFMSIEHKHTYTSSRWQQQMMIRNLIQFDWKEKIVRVIFIDKPRSQ